MHNFCIYVRYAMSPGPDGFPKQKYIIFEVWEEAFFSVFSVFHVFSNIKKSRDWADTMGICEPKGDPIEKLCMCWSLMFKCGKVGKISQWHGAI